MTNRIEIDHLTLAAADAAVMNGPAGTVGLGVLANSDFSFEMTRKGNHTVVAIEKRDSDFSLRIGVGVQTLAGAGDRDLCTFLARRVEIAGGLEV